MKGREEEEERDGADVGVCGQPYISYLARNSAHQTSTSCLKPFHVLFLLLHNLGRRDQLSLVL